MTPAESLINAESAVKPYLSIFKNCYDGAIKEYNSHLMAFKNPMYNRTKAILFQNVIVNRIKDAFSENKDVVIREKYESITMIIDNYVYARFKKLNQKGLPSNVTTARNDAIISQQLTLGFANYPPVARIDVGYKLNETGTDYELLKVACRKDNKIIWDLYFHDINDKGETGSAEITIFPRDPHGDNQTGRVKFNQEIKKAK